MQTRILVAGGAGFVGSSLCKRLLDLGHKVLCADNLTTGTLSNVEPLFQNNCFSFCEADVENKLGFNVDIIYNLASPASPQHYQKDPVKTLKTNFLGTMNLLELAEAKNAIFVQASTSEVYGDPSVTPQTEDYNGNVSVSGVRACYDEGKRVAETLCFDYARARSVDTRVMRLFNTYGPNMALDDGRVVPNFIKAAIKNKPLSVYGDGLQTRSFCYIDDMIDALVKVLEPSSIPEPINLGNPQEVTIIELAETIRGLIGGTSIIQHLQLPQDDPKQRKPDIARASKLLSWTPTVGLKEGLTETINHFKNKLA